jgi:hypothetical protein
MLTPGAFPAAMKRRLMFIGLPSRPLHRISFRGFDRAKIRARRFFACACESGMRGIFELARSHPSFRS